MKPRFFLPAAVSGALFASVASGSTPTAAADGAETALKRAGEWLVAAQNEDGSFSNPKFPGLTAIALWGLEGAAAAKESAGADASAERAAASRATDWILSKAQPDGGFYTPVPGRAGGGLSTYNTALCLTALSFAKRDDADFTAKILAARSFLATQQLAGDDSFAGGFGYDKEAPHRYADLNNSTFAMEAMRRTQRFEEMRPAGEKKADLDWGAALKFAESLHNGADAGDSAGGFAYSPADAKAGTDGNAGEKVVLRSYGSITYSGLLALVYCKLEAHDPRVRSTLDWASRHWTLEENPGVGDQGLYFFYDIIGRSLSVAGISAIPRAGDQGGEIDWRSELKAKMAALQREDGSYANRNGRFWENDRVLTTGYSAVTLAFATGALR
ncbi:MAG: hypothetical protein IJS46_02045 [Kiritimatiellae bacterium]|nr:hypothetical protein [Kiritimatiellia bacterium]